jgi:hypothetical protein
MPFIHPCHSDRPIHPSLKTASKAPLLLSYARPTRSHSVNLCPPNSIRPYSFPHSLSPSFLPSSPRFVCFPSRFAASGLPPSFVRRPAPFTFRFRPEESGTDHFSLFLLLFSKDWETIIFTRSPSLLHHHLS